MGNKLGPVFPKYIWDGKCIARVERYESIPNLFDFPVYDLFNIPGVKDFFSKIHIGRFTGEKPDIIFGVDASETHTNVYILNQVKKIVAWGSNEYISMAYVRLVKRRKVWRMYDSGLYT